MADQFNSTSTSHRTGYGADAERTSALLAWLTKYPDATLASGEARLLLQYIRMLERQLDAGMGVIDG